MRLMPREIDLIRSLATLGYPTSLFMFYIFFTKYSLGEETNRRG